MGKHLSAYQVLGGWGIVIIDTEQHTEVCYVHRLGGDIRGIFNKTIEQYIQ